MSNDEAGLRSQDPGTATQRFVPLRHPEAPDPGAQIPSHYAMCFGCGSEVPAGLHLAITAEAGLRVSAEFEVGEQHQGAPGLAHGGVLAAAFDEALGGLNWLLLVPAVTGTLETRFRRPVPVGHIVHIDAEIVGQEGRKVFTRAVGRIDGPDGPVAMDCDAVYIQVSLEHFKTHGRAEEVERVAMERAVAPGGPAHSLDVNP